MTESEIENDQNDLDQNDYIEPAHAPIMGVGSTDHFLR